MDIFNIIPENFFSLLSSKNKRLYVACIIQVFNVYEQGSILGIDKSIIVDDLANFLENNQAINFSLDTDSKNEEISSKRELASFILRRMEECGWIYVDVNNDYIEILNFTDHAITLVEAILNICPSEVDDETFDTYKSNSNEYQGYIFTIYSLLSNANNIEYGLIMSQIFKNAKMLIRSLRKLDSRLKDYIGGVVETAEIKDLMEKLISYKIELVDNNYQKLKTSDNVNKYRLKIVGRLEEFQRDEYIMRIIVNDYIKRFGDADLANKRANRDIDEIIDVFNSLDEIITEIDLKNKTYINSTIGKIKFLLSEDDNVIGKLNSIMKFIKTSKLNDKLDKAIDTIKPLYNLGTIKNYNDNSLYTPRGAYSHNLPQTIDLERFGFSDLGADFMGQFILPYNQNMIVEFIEENMVDKKILASDIIKYNTDINTVMKVIYSVLYSTENKCTVNKLEQQIYHYKFTMYDFLIEKE